MTSTVSICNLALSHLGKDNINALDEASTEARACRQFFEQVRDALLVSYPWTFAQQMRALAQKANPRPEEWGFAYAHPNDCLKLRRLAVSMAALKDYSTQSPPYDIVASTILCDLSPAFASFTVRVTDVTKFPPLFVEALSWQLAVRLAMPLTRDPKIRADAYQIGAQTQVQAEVADASEHRDTFEWDSEFLAARL